MSPDDTLRRLNIIGVNISRKTLYNWEQWGLISAPVFRNSRVTEYPETVCLEAYAAYCLLQGKYISGELPVSSNQAMKIKAPKIPPETVAVVRRYIEKRKGSLRSKIKKLIKEKEWHGPDGTPEDWAKFGKDAWEVAYYHEMGPFILTDEEEFAATDEIYSFLDFLADIWVEKTEEAGKKLKSAK